jgi:hypothetical protein
LINTENYLQIEKVAADRKLHRMAKVLDLLVMWQGSQNLNTTKKKYCAEIKEMKAA